MNILQKIKGWFVKPKPEEVVHIEPVTVADYVRGREIGRWTIVDEIDGEFEMSE